MATFDEQLPEWNEPGVEPPQSKKDSGYQPGDKPPAQWFNWSMNRIYKVLQELRAKVAFKADVGDMSTVPTTAKTAAGAITELHEAINADGGVTDAKIGNRTIDSGLAGGANTGTLTQLLSWIGKMIKAITGKANWYTAPRTTLENAVKLNGDTMTGNLAAPNLPNKTTADLTLYVDAVNGNDVNDGLAAGAGRALKTITAAIAKVPQIVNHIVTINVADGTYNEDIEFRGFQGGQTITLQGNETTPANVKVSSLTCILVSTQLSVRGFNFTATAEGKNPIYVVITEYCYVYKCLVNGVSATTNGISFSDSRGFIQSATISNRHRAISVTNGAIVQVAGCAGTGNTIALEASGGASIAKVDLLMPAGSEVANPGAQIIEGPLRATQASMSFYVSPTGNDKNDGRTSGTAVKTITEALRRVPQVVNHYVQINLAAGTYPENISVEGFVGKGSVAIIGGSVIGDAYSVASFTAINNQAKILVQGIKATTTGRTGFSFINCANGYASLLRCSDVSATEQGLSVEAGKVYVYNCHFQGRQHGIFAYVNGDILAQGCSGNGNTWAHGAAYGGRVHIDGSRITGTDNVGTGGIIANNQGVENPWGDNTANQRPFSHAFRSTLQSMLSATWTKVLYDTELRDHNGDYNPTTGDFTAPRNGIYLIRASVIWNTPGTDTCALRLFVNGSADVYLAEQLRATNASDSVQHGTVFVELNAGQTVSVYAYSSSGTSIQGNSATYMQVCRIA